MAALEDGPRIVTAVVAATGLSQSNASRHPACPRGCGLGDRPRRGREVHQRLADEMPELVGAPDPVLAGAGTREAAA